jgi:hypothetical protein
LGHFFAIGKGHEQDECGDPCNRLCEEPCNDKCEQPCDDKCDSGCDHRCDSEKSSEHFRWKFGPGSFLNAKFGDDAISLKLKMKEFA